MKNTFLALGLVLLFLGCQNNVGKQLPDFKETTAQQITLSKDQLKGKVTVINVWATWCGTCVAEIGALNQLAEKYKDNPKVKLIAVSDESKEVVEAFLQKRPFHWEHIYSSSELADMLQTRLVRTYPQTLVIDQDLNVVFDQSGGTAGIGETLDQLIQGMLQKP